MCTSSTLLRMRSRVAAHSLLRRTIRPSVGRLTRPCGPSRARASIQPASQCVGKMLPITIFSWMFCERVSDAHSRFVENKVKDPCAAQGIYIKCEHAPMARSRIAIGGPHRAQRPRWPSTAARRRGSVCARPRSDPGPFRSSPLTGIFITPYSRSSPSLSVPVSVGVASGACAVERPLP